MKVRSKSFFKGENEKIYEAGEGVVRQFVAYDPSMMMVKVMFETGAVGTAHTHPHAQATYIVSGRFEFTVGNETQLLKAGDGLYIEPNELHGCKCIEHGTLIDVFTPIRDDFYSTIATPDK